MKNFHPHSCPRCTKEFKETTQLLSHLKNNPNCKDESKKVIIKRERNDEMKEESEDKPKKLKVCPCLYQTISTIIFTRCGRVVTDFEREAKTRCNFQF